MGVLKNKMKAYLKWINTLYNQLLTLHVVNKRDNKPEKTKIKAKFKPKPFYSSQSYQS